jgi:uncharacterized protein (DUF362 family)
MDRRNFLKNTVLTSAAAGAMLANGNYSELFAAGNNYDLVAVKGGESETMFDKAIEAMGGMKQFVKKGQKVVVKPNIGWDVPPERAGNTNPKLVARIIEHCYNAGAKEVYVFDNTCDKWDKTYKTSGIEYAVKNVKGKMVSGASESSYHHVEFKGGKKLTNAKVHELILESDVFINVPILKAHSSAKLTMALKNLMGIVWDRRFWHSNDLHQCIADFGLYPKKPTLNVLDAYRVMKRNGPRGVSVEDVITMKSLLLSTDIVAIDAAGAKLFGIEPDEVSYIKIAAQIGAGKKDLSKLNIKRISI